MDRIVVDFDHHSGQYATNSCELLRSVRERAPLAYSEAHGGFWVATGYETVFSVLEDPKTFSAKKHLPGISTVGGITIPSLPVNFFPQEEDPPVHTVYRRQLNPLLNPTAIGPIIEATDAYMTEAIDRVIERGRCDIVTDIANPVTARLTLHMLGLEEEEWERFSQPNHDLAANPVGSEAHARALEEVVWIYEQITLTVAERRKHPMDDLISQIAEFRIEGELISEEEVSQIARLLVIGGTDTTTNLVANMCYWLSRHPDDRRRLIAEAELLPKAIEEFLRYFSPAQAMARTVACDVLFEGQQLRAGERVLFSLAGANRDPAAFPDPDEVILDRQPNRHVAFGLGVHKCVGAHVARRWAHSMMSHILERMPTFTVIDDGVRRYPDIGGINGLINLPCVFAPGEQIG
jgi:cytochrome P450